MNAIDSPRALVVGGVSWDTVVRVAELPTARPHTVFSQDTHEGVGSTGAGKALNLRLLGWPVSLHALLGDDEPGRRAASALRAAGIRLLAETDPQGTERHINLVADNGDRVSIYTHYASYEPTIDLATLQAEAAQHAVVVLNIANYARRLIGPLRAAGRQIWCDVHDWDGQEAYHQDFVDAADALFLSSDRLPGYRDTMQALAARRRRRLIVCTHGARGASALDADGRWIDVTPVPVPRVVDSNGAGDAFMAAVLHALHHGRSVDQALQQGAALGAACVQARGLVGAPVPWA